MTIGREQIEQAAAEWLARQDRGLSDAEAAALAAWLEDSVANRTAWLRLQAGWQRTERLAALQGSELAGGGGTWRHRRLTALAALAAMLLLMVGGYFLLPRETGQVYVAQSSDRPVLHLADGTRIQLNGNTQVKTNVTGAERVVTLERGEAYFEVVHDAKRPFTVYAGNRRITDLGTKFSVRREGNDVKITVTEGKVRVDVLNAPAAAAPVYAVQGNVVLARADETLVAPKTIKELEDDLSWRTDMLTFDQETLAAAAEQFNRYNTRKIVVTGEARDIKIGGSFRADNIDVFAQLVKNALGLKVSQTQEQITISQ